MNYINYINYIAISFVGGIITALLIYIIIKIYYKYSIREYSPINNEWIIVRI